MESPGKTPHTDTQRDFFPSSTVGHTAAHLHPLAKAQIQMGGINWGFSGQKTAFCSGWGQQRLGLRSWQALPERILKVSKGSLNSHFPCPPFEWRAYLYLFWLKAVLTDIKQVKTKHSFSKSCLFSWSCKKNLRLFYLKPGEKMCDINSSLSGCESSLPTGQGNTRNTPVCLAKPHGLGLGNFSGRTNKGKAGGSPGPACVSLLGQPCSSQHTGGVMWEES